MPLRPANSFVPECHVQQREKSSDVTHPGEILAAYLDHDAERLEDAGELLPPGGLRPVQMQDVPPQTRSGKIELFPEVLNARSSAGLYEYLPDRRDAQHPLALISPSTSQTVNSTFGQLLTKPAVLRMHPADANSRSLTSGQTVQVFNASGRVVLDLEIDQRIRPGVVEIPKGIWLRSTRNGKTSNALSPDTLSDIGKGACFNDARVQVAKYSL